MLPSALTLPLHLAYGWSFEIPSEMFLLKYTNHCLYPFPACTLHYLRIWMIFLAHSHIHFYLCFCCRNYHIVMWLPVFPLSLMSNCKLLEEIICFFSFLSPGCLLDHRDAQDRAWHSVGDLKYLMNEQGAIHAFWNNKRNFMQVRERNPVGNTTGKVRNRGHRIKWRVFSNSHYVARRSWVGMCSWWLLETLVGGLKEVDDWLDLEYRGEKVLRWNQEFMAK